MRGTNIERRIPFAGLTTHDRTEMSEKAAAIAGIDSESPPDTSLSQAVRSLETADSGGLAWTMPDAVASSIDIEAFNEDAPDGVEAVHGVNGGVFVETDRFQSLFSPDKLREYMQATQNSDDDDTFEGRDPLWHVPTKDYSIVNPTDAWQPLQKAIREEDLGGEVFGEIRTYKGGGEAHMDVLFDNYQIEYTNDDEGRDPIVLGIRSGYDFFGGTALYFEGFAQDTRCDNSIRAITDEKVFRHVGEHDLEEEVQDILAELGVMTSRLAELIELAEDIEIDLPSMNFAEVFEHADNLRGFYELAGFPSYLAREAAQHARHRADNQFLPDMTDVWDGATYALTHHYRGGEQTSRVGELIDRANDFVYNPSLVMGEIEHEYTRRVGQAEGEQEDLEGESATAKVETFTQSVRDKADEFESRNDELRQTLVAEVGDADEEVATDGGEEPNEGDSVDDE